MIILLNNEAELAEWREDLVYKRLGFIATMGALHDGHMELVKAASKKCDVLIASIFVNPAQFDEAHDLEHYPRTLDADLELLAKHGVDAVFIPNASEIYPEQFKTIVLVEGLTDVLCGATRPGHFDGVATIITILLNMINPDISFFGEKDAQQLLVLQRLQKDLRLSGTIEGVPTARASDGLALSSRNKNLSQQERAIAPVLHQTLIYLKDEIISGANIDDAISRGAALIIESGFDSIDYLELRNEQSLSLIEHNEKAFKARLFIAARIGKTRLIDNIPVTR